MEFEREFYAAGGRLLAGIDPTGWGGLVAGFGNQRQVELLVAAGLRPEEAIRVASAHGAYFLQEGLIGTVTAGLQADLFVVSGNPATSISDVRNVELVFKKGLAFDPAKLIAATRGTVGRFDISIYTRSRWMWLAGVVFVILVARRLRRRFGSVPA